MKPKVLIAMTTIALLMSASGASFAQEWAPYLSEVDHFSANFPGDPEVKEITWETEYGAVLPARVYAAKQGPNTYSLTVVDYNPVEEILTQKSKDCPPNLERCDGLTAYSGAGYWKNDVRGAMLYATSKFLKRDNIKVTHYMWSHLGQGVEVHELQLTNNPDRSRTFVAVYMHHNRLYVAEGTHPENYPPPGIFQQSISLLHAEGEPERHNGVYFNSAELDPDEVFEGQELIRRERERIRQFQEQERSRR